MQAEILVPLDGSPRAEAILTPLIPLARATGSRLTLVQAIVLDAGIAPVLGMVLRPKQAAQWLAVFRQSVVDYLSEVAHRVERPGWPVRTAVLEGEPRHAIRAYATQHPEVRLIAMATHGRRGVNRWVFGSVAEELLHEAPVPVLLLRMPASATPSGRVPMLRTIVVPLDGSAFAETALDQAQALARATGARLVLLTAVSSLDEARVATGEIPLWMEQQRQFEIDKLVGYQQNLAAQLEAKGVQVAMQIGDGRPADVIRQLSAERKADLIVMATHGRTRSQRLRLGSVALDVVEHATTPVFLVCVSDGPPQTADRAAAEPEPAGSALERIDKVGAGTH